MEKEHDASEDVGAPAAGKDDVEKRAGCGEKLELPLAAGVEHLSRRGLFRKVQLRRPHGGMAVFAQGVFDALARLSVKQKSHAAL